MQTRTARNVHGANLDRFLLSVASYSYAEAHLQIAVHPVPPVGCCSTGLKCILGKA